MAAEDAVLVECVRSHGEGNWNTVQKNTRIIIELHAKMGNKWALMASQIKDDGLLENMLQEAKALNANGHDGNKEMPKEMMNAAQNGEEDYSRLINIDGPFSLGMVIPEWRNDSGESSERQPFVITDNENHLALDMHQIASLYPADISPNHAVRSSGVRSWDNFPVLQQ
ncbi:transcriptional activator Myb-like [Gossypium australe]|uniref:Transcriptional activator Myb-like n=1 Tax=Gossypium australe TaxID=47621 RepID=A0A5B6VUC5_9ROSI|nr:transcriptional activator Myb-like [Gossypium australe]